MVSGAACPITSWVVIPPSPKHSGWFLKKRKAFYCLESHSSGPTLALPQPRGCSQLEPVVLAVAPSSDPSVQHQALMDQLLKRDPRETSLISPLQLLERQLERLPPVLLPDPWIDYQDLSWNRVFSLERQLKRVADLLVSVLLLVLTTPFLLIAMLFIWLEDRGPVFYCQQHSGWLSCSFQVYKLR